MEESKTNIQNQAGVSFSLKWGKVLIFHATILLLKEPKYVRFLFNPQEKRLAIQCCDKKVPEAFAVPKYNPDNWEFVIKSMEMMRMIYRCCNWNDEKTYRAYGAYYEKYNLVEYELNSAGVIEDSQFVDPRN